MSRSPGRPRDPDVERRILEAALRHLAEFGYQGMSLDAVAAEVGASKPTMYRRWASKADLATAAVSTLRLREAAVPDSGNAVEDLTAILRNFRRSLLRPNGMSLIGTVLAEESALPELLRLFRERLVEPRRRSLLDVLARAAERGELREGADVEVAVNALVGAFYARYLADGVVPEDWPDRVVGVVWPGLRR